MDWAEAVGSDELVNGLNQLRELFQDAQDLDNLFKSICNNSELSFVFKLDQVQYISRYPPDEELQSRVQSLCYTLQSELVFEVRGLIEGEEGGLKKIVKLLYQSESTLDEFGKALYKIKSLFKNSDKLICYAMIRDDVLLVFRRWHFALNDGWPDSVLASLDRHNFLSIMAFVGLSGCCYQICRASCPAARSSRSTSTPPLQKSSSSIRLSSRHRCFQVKGMKDIRQPECSRLKNEKDAEDQTDVESVMEIDRETDYNTSTRVLHLLLIDGERTVCGFEQSAASARPLSVPSNRLQTPPPFHSLQKWHLLPHPQKLLIS
ncbi:hypothetical protein WR25_05886 [Diploscapter pachys]|uniref:Uncharacterized protein n=1 Tax=Diploscapter pachys TaxID=2018661 RepID=A0A2A2J458_9BILA|nr:hypothetical protein WR25_05886 [Diploscapter pachys]